MGENNKRKILIVEDEEDICRIIRKHLETEGYTVLVAYDGQEAYELVKKELPDLILLDVKIPKIDGVTLNTFIKKDEKFRHIPVIVMTAHAQYKEVFEMNKEAPIDDFIVKPFPIGLLVEKIKKVLG
jgi:DNA-binding response OmpR family regulator